MTIDNSARKQTGMCAAFILSLGSTSPFPIRSFHKKFCTQNSTCTSKLVSTLVANPFINLYLQIALAGAFQLDKNRNTSQPLIGRCDVIVRPSNGLFLDLAIGKIATQDILPTEGMIQLRNFVPIHPRSQDSRDEDMDSIMGER